MTLRDFREEVARFRYRSLHGDLYRNFRDNVRIFRDRRRRAPAHYHGCPTCYEPEGCVLDCMIEPDLGTHRGCPYSSYDICSTCRKAGITDG